MRQHVAEGDAKISLCLIVCIVHEVDVASIQIPGVVKQWQDQMRNTLHRKRELLLGRCQNVIRLFVLEQNLNGIGIEHRTIRSHQESRVLAVEARGNVQSRIVCGCLRRYHTHWICERLEKAVHLSSGNVLQEDKCCVRVDARHRESTGRVHQLLGQLRCRKACRTRHVCGDGHFALGLLYADVARADNLEGTQLLDSSKCFPVGSLQITNQSLLIHDELPHRFRVDGDVCVRRYGSECRFEIGNQRLQVRLGRLGLLVFEDQNHVSQ